MQSWQTSLHWPGHRENPGFPGSEEQLCLGSMNSAVQLPHMASGCNSVTVLASALSAQVLGIWEPHRSKGIRDISLTSNFLCKAKQKLLQDTYKHLHSAWSWFNLLWSPWGFLRLWVTHEPLIGLILQCHLDPERKASNLKSGPMVYVMTW